MELLQRHTTIMNYKINTVIYSNSVECLGVILLLKGCLRTYMLSEQGKDITLYRLNPGDTCILSASCILRNITFDVTIEAEQDSSVLLLNTSMFQKLMQSNMQNVTHAQIAKYIGSAREVVSRMLKSFEADGQLSLARNSTILIDKRRLKQITTGSQKNFYCSAKKGL